MVGQQISLHQKANSSSNQALQEHKQASTGDDCEFVCLFCGRPYLHSSIFTELQSYSVGTKKGLVCEETNLADHMTKDGAKNPLA